MIRFPLQRRLLRLTLPTLLVSAVLLGGSTLVAAQSHGGLIPAGDTPDLVLLYSGDVIGYLDPCG